MEKYFKIAGIEISGEDCFGNFFHPAFCVERSIIPGAIYTRYEKKALNALKISLKQFIESKNA